MTGRSIVTIGVFDGVHRGHRAVIEKVVERARKRSMMSALVTFDPHPLKILSRSHEAASLISLKHRVALIKALGIDRVVVLKFDKNIARMSARDFVKKILIKKLRVKEVVIGEDFSFGRGAMTDVKGLETIGRDLGVRTDVVRHVRIGRSVVSSSIIRKFVTGGRIKEAALFLGRPYSILGTVVSGSKLGRELGYPTANINPHHEAVPPSGVYAVKTRFKNKTYKGVMNIGVKPTFYDRGKDKEPSIEMHIFNFNERIYGRDLEIVFAKRLRSEKKFKKIDSLIGQIKKDETLARKVLK